MIRALFEMTGRGAPAPAFTEAEWRELLAFADRTQLTLHLRGTRGLPSWLAEEIETRYIKNAERRRRLRAAYIEAADALGVAGIDFVMLKGFTHEVGEMAGRRPAPQTRVQYDLDLLTLPCDVARARTVFERLGYAAHGAQSLSEEHLRPMLRPSNWSWRGDYYDPEMPIPIELHSSAWSAERDRVHPVGMEEFWSRRRLIQVNGLEIPAFDEADRLAFAALHVLRHILRHDARPAHVLELARFLDACECGADALARDPTPWPGLSRTGASGAVRGDRPTTFWDQWRNLHPRELRDLQSVAFRFAHEWFGCTLPAATGHPKSVEAWFAHYAWSPVANLTGPNKDAVWLHLALIASPWDRIRVLCDRLVPLRLPHEAFSGRLRYHAGALAPALASGVRWWWRRTAASTASEISNWNRRKV